MLLKNKKVLITGGSRGVGAAIAEVYAAHGADLILLASNKEKLEIVKQKCESINGTCEIHVVDLRKNKEIDEFLDKIFDIDVIINCAGVMARGTSTTGDADLWENMFKVNIIAPMRIGRKLIPKMVEKHEGCIINISSIAGLRGMGAVGGYCATKFAMIGYTQSLYEELRNSNIKVMCINPAYIDTDMVSGREDLNYDRMIKPKDIADVCMLPFTLSKNTCPTEITIKLTLPAN